MNRAAFEQKCAAIRRRRALREVIAAIAYCAVVIGGGLAYFIYATN